MDFVMAARFLSRNSRSCGFTLVETLVALVLLSLVFLLLTEGLRFIMNNDRKQAGGEADVSRTQIFLENLISQARPALVRDRQSMTGESVAFAGSSTSLQLLSPAPNAVAVGGLYDVNIVFDQKDKQVEITWGLYRPSGPIYDDKAVLLKHVTEAKFTYFGKLNNKIAWSDSWQHSLSLPLLVRVQLSFSNDSTIWPDFVVSPKITSHRSVKLNFDMP